jgi:hypothetical protein
MENGYGTVEEFFKRQYMQALVDIAKDSIPQVKRLLKSVKRNHIPGIGKKAVEWDEKSVPILSHLGERGFLYSASTEIALFLDKKLGLI